MSKSNVNPNHYKVAGRERQGEDVVHARHRQKHAQSVVRGRSEHHARVPQPVNAFGPAVPGARKRTAKKATRATSANQQAADKRGKRSTAQKRASSRYGFGPIPASSSVAGAFGKEPSPRRRPEPKG